MCYTLYYKFTTPKITYFTVDVNRVITGYMANAIAMFFFTYLGNCGSILRGRIYIPYPVCCL